MPDAIAPSHDHVPPSPIPLDPDLRPIDLAAPGSPDRLDDEARLHLARAGQDALDACLSRFAPEERAAFWRAFCRCYNRPYNAAEIPPPETPPPEASHPGAVLQASPGPVPAPHVIEAVGILPEVALR